MLLNLNNASLPPCFCIDLISLCTDLRLDITLFTSHFSRIERITSLLTDYSMAFPTDGHQPVHPMQSAPNIECSLRLVTRVPRAYVSLRSLPLLCNACFVSRSVFPSRLRKQPGYMEPSASTTEAPMSERRNLGYPYLAISTAYWTSGLRKILVTHVMLFFFFYKVFCYFYVVLCLLSLNRLVRMNSSLKSHLALDLILLGLLHACLWRRARAVLPLFCISFLASRWPLFAAATPPPVPLVLPLLPWLFKNWQCF